MTNQKQGTGQGVTKFVWWAGEERAVSVSLNDESCSIGLRMRIETARLESDDCFTEVAGVKESGVNGRAMLCLAIAVTLCSCTIVPEQVPVSAETSWYLQADTDTRAGVTLTKGETRTAVVSDLGHPKSAWHFSGRANIEVLEYLRVVAGPSRTKTVNTVNGETLIRSPTFFIDTIRVYLDAGTVVVVTKERGLLDDNLDARRL